MSEPQEVSYRKPLLISSTTLLLYSIAGGSIVNKISYFGSVIEFSRPEYLEYCLIVFMIYFLWRHWQETTVTRTNLYKMLDISIKLKDVEDRGPLWKYVVNERVDSKSGQGIELKILWFGKLLVPKKNHTQYDDFGDIETFKERPKPQSKICKSACMLISLSHMVKVFIKDTHFANSIFPVLVSFAAFIAYLCNQLAPACT